MRITDRAQTWVQRVVLFIVLIAVVVQGYVIAFVRVPLVRDFDVHRMLGERFLAHAHLYDTGYFGYPYMPIAAMYFAPLALMDRGVALGCRYAVAILCLCLTLFLCYRMTRDRAGMTPRNAIWLSLVAVLLSLQFVLQDLDDGGPHLILLAILTAGIYAVWRGREKWGGMWFGLAASLKVTSALFLPFFLWKRRWRLAGYTAVATMCWILLPLVYMTPASWWQHQWEWTQVAVRSFVGKDSTVTLENEQRVRNQSLRQAVLRYTVTLPEDHPLRREDPGYVPVLNLSYPTAKSVALALMASMVVVFSWLTRRAREPVRDPAWLRESSAVLIIALLLSPVTWVQHLVWLIPALYLIAWDARSDGRFRASAKLALGAYVVLAVLLNYEFLGKRNFELVLSYHPYTIAMFLVLVMLMWTYRPAEAIADSGSRLDPHIAGRHV